MIGCCRGARQRPESQRDSSDVSPLSLLEKVFEVGFGVDFKLDPALQLLKGLYNSTLQDTCAISCNSIGS